MKWGVLAIINLYNCDKNLIKDKKKIKEFVSKLCKNINMRKFGSTRIKKFGKDSLKGYSALQFLETSSITVHFDEQKNRSFIDIFSCKDFNIKNSEKFSKDFFKAKKSTSKKVIRQ